jgi:hypothetical protein
MPIDDSIKAVPGDHVSEELADLYNQLRDPECRQFTLLSCFVDGKPSAAIAIGSQEFRPDWPRSFIRFNTPEDGTWYFYTLFVLPTEGMRIEFSPQ